MIIVLYTSSCCKEGNKIKKELIDNPPNANVVIKYLNYASIADEAVEKDVVHLPTIILYFDNECIEEIFRWTDSITTETINNKIKEYESKRLV